MEAMLVMSEKFAVVMPAVPSPVSTKKSLFAPSTAVPMVTVPVPIVSTRRTRSPLMVVGNPSEASVVVPDASTGYASPLFATVCVDVYTCPTTGTTDGPPSAGKLVLAVSEVLTVGIAKSSIKRVTACYTRFEAGLKHAH